MPFVSVFADVFFVVFVALIPIDHLSYVHLPDRGNVENDADTTRPVAYSVPHGYANGCQPEATIDMQMHRFAAIPAADD